MRGPASLARRLRRDARGTALIEFAFVFPILILLFVGGYQLSDAVFAYRKVTATARTVADVTSQFTSVSDSDLDTVLNASEQVLAPYDVTKASLRITQVTINASGTATVAWSRGKNAAPYVVGTTFFVPATYKQNSATIIVADVSYRYTPSFAASMIGTYNLTEQVTMYPRRSTTITKS